MPHPRSLGTVAEDRAARFLQDCGLTILTRRYKARHGEIDLVALDGETLVFVEVRFRRSLLEKPEASLNDRKRVRLTAAAVQYLADFVKEERPVRYDLVAIDPDGIRHHREAFWP